MADMTGVPQKMLRIVPDMEKMESMGMGIADLEAVLSSNNVEPGSMLVRDGYYEYTIRIASILRTPEDVKNIYFNRNGRVMQLSDICSVQTVTHHERGRSLAGGKRAVTLAIIKQGEENMDNLRKELKETTDYFIAHLSRHRSSPFRATRPNCWIIPFRTCSRTSRWGSCSYLWWRCSLSVMCVRLWLSVYQYDNFGGHHLLLFLYLPHFAQCHFSVGLDSGGGHDDRQCYHCDGKYIAIP